MLEAVFCKYFHFSLTEMKRNQIKNPATSVPRQRSGKLKKM